MKIPFFLAKSYNNTGLFVIAQCNVMAVLESHV